MRLRRFESLKSHATAAVADKSLMATDDWWPIRAGIEDFVANRKRTVLKSAGLVPDESMSAMKVRSTKNWKVAPHHLREAQAQAPRHGVQVGLRRPARG